MPKSNTREVNIIDESTDESSDEEQEPQTFSKASYEEYKEYATVFEDTGEVSDESFDPQYIEEVLDNHFFNECGIDDKGHFLCGIVDSKRNIYKYRGGICSMTHKFVSFEDGYVEV